MENDSGRKAVSIQVPHSARQPSTSSSSPKRNFDELMFDEWAASRAPN